MWQVHPHGNGAVSSAWEHRWDILYAGYGLSMMLLEQAIEPTVRKVWRGSLSRVVWRYCVLVHVSRTIDLPSNMQQNRNKAGTKFRQRSRMAFQTPAKNINMKRTQGWSQTNNETIKSILNPSKVSIDGQGTARPYRLRTPRVSAPTNPK